MKRVWLIVLFVGSVLSIRAQNNVSTGVVRLPPDPIGLCEVWKNPRRYRGKVIRVQAVLVENNNKGLIDGAIPFLYDPTCRTARHSTRVDWSTAPKEGISAREALAQIRSKESDKYQVSRAMVIATGVFSGFRKRENDSGMGFQVPPQGC